jgi:hypothetical protein
MQDMTASLNDAVEHMGDEFANLLVTLHSKDLSKTSGPYRSPSISKTYQHRHQAKSTKTLCGGCHHQIPLETMRLLSRRTKQEQAAGSSRPKNFLPGIEPVVRSCG